MKKSIILFSILLLLSSCQRENLDEFTGATQTTSPNFVVNSSVVGLITDEYGEAVSGAIVSLGNITTSTNELGLFSIEDETISKNAAYVQVEKEGFFNGSRKFSTELDGQANIRIQLLEKELLDEISTQSGGVVEFESASIELPQGNYVNEAGELFSGSVEVYAKWLDPTVIETFDQMPGELTGINSEGNLNALATYGMMAVELRNSFGEYLSLPEGTSATIKMKVPDELMVTAPSVIPLWHFNEMNGNWEEEGQATLIGNEYVGEVTHFSFWNCDVPFPLVEISGNIELNGSPYEGALIKITDLSSGFCAYSYSGERGYFSGKVPEGNDLVLSVLGLCHTELEDFELGSIFENKELGVFSVSSVIGNIEEVTIQGNYSNCLEEDFDLAFIIVENQDFQQFIQVNSDGSFHDVLPICMDTDELFIYAFDLTYSLISEVQVFEITELIDLDIEACLDDFLNGAIIEYSGMNWDPLDPSFDLSFEIDTLPEGSEDEFYYRIDGTNFDTNTGVIVPLFTAEFWFTPGSSFGEPSDYQITFNSQGFSIEGECIINLAHALGLSIIIIEGVYIGEPEVFNEQTYPGEIDFVSFNFVIPNI